ncbi:MAG: DEAD/DEAH box helicase family protein [Acinetobacter sp.]|nr:DEAD/DEAH box helicase family protein [Acinetobacter sp.]
MTYIPRPYQEKGIQAPFDYWAIADGNPLIVAPTQSGKALMIAEFIKRACGLYPETRILVLAHVAKLLKQNAATLMKQWPHAPFGFYSASIGRKDHHSKILFAGIQSIYRKASIVGHVDIIQIDEAHLISPNQATMYRQFIAALLIINPKLKVVGYTATPYRQNQGYLTEGKEPIFTDIAFEIPVLYLLEEGYLTPVITPATNITMDVSGVGKSGGEFITTQLDAAVNVDKITKACVAEIIHHMKERNFPLVFCVTVKHAENTVAEFKIRGLDFTLVTGDTPETERDVIYAQFERGEIDGIVNVMTMTTGISIPCIDLIVLMRPLRSPSSYVQTVGRGMALVDGSIGNLPTKELRLAAIAASSCPNCMVLDFGGVVKALGPIDNVKVKKPGNGTGDAPLKQCPECLSINHAAVRVCFDCGYEWPEPEPNVETNSSKAAILSSQIESVWEDVEDVIYQVHKKKGKPDSIKISYIIGMISADEWVFPEHPTMKNKFAGWWIKRGGVSHDIPQTTARALEWIHELEKPSRILVRPNGKFYDILEHDFGT